jgi:molybdenum ABC transporter molybdate-binding protein
MKMFKKTMVLMMVTVMLMVAGCGNSASADKSQSSKAAVASTTESEKSTQAGTKKAVSEFKDVNTDAVKLIALGNSDVPVGQYSQEIFQNLGFWDKIQSKISYGSTVKEVLSQVEESSVDCGVVYATDAATSKGVKVVCKAPDGSLKTPVVYPVAPLSKSQNPEAAKAFLNFLLTDDAVNEFKKVGFKMATDAKPTEVKADATCTLNVFAAASMTESFKEIQKLFNTKYPSITLVFNFDSSGTLQKQVEQGAAADIFVSAAQKQVDALQKEGYINGDSVIKLLQNEVVLIVPNK